MAEDAEEPPPLKTCLHCALARALQAESSALADGGVQLLLAPSEAAWLPEPGFRIYRQLRRLLRQSIRQAQPGSRLKVAIINQTGKSHLEVQTTFLSGNGWRVLTRSFPRYEVKTLWHGFSEHA